MIGNITNKHQKGSSGDEIMGKNILTRKVKRRGRSLRRMIRGRIENNLGEPTKSEIKFFQIGFNMGWKEQIDERVKFNRHADENQNKNEEVPSYELEDIEGYEL